MDAPQFSAPRQGLTGAVFMIGMAVLFATDWFWPGILVLVGITSLLGTYLEKSEPDEDDIPLRVDVPAEGPPAEVRYARKCSSCGAATPQALQEGTTDRGVACSYCGSQLERVS